MQIILHRGCRAVVNDQIIVGRSTRDIVKMGRVADLSTGAHIAIGWSTEFVFAQRQKRLVLH